MPRSSIESRIEVLEGELVSLRLTVRALEDRLGGDFELVGAPTTGAASRATPTSVAKGSESGKGNKTYEGQVLNPAQVVSPFAAAVALCKRGNSLGESIFVGLPRWSDVGIVAEWCEVEVSFVSHDGGRGASA
jgi:hypothetical protein